MSNSLDKILGQYNNVESINGGPLGGFRNKIINGDFDIWQRGTTFSNPADGTYGSDRWVVTRNNTSGTRSLFRREFTVGHTEVPGNPRYYLTYDHTAAASGLTYDDVQQRIENVRLLSGKTITITAYIRHSTQTSLPEIFLAQDFGSSGSSTVFTTVDTSITISSSFAKVQYVVNVPSVSGKTIGAGSFTSLAFRVPLNVTGTFDISHVSLVEGDATGEDDPFSPRHLQQEIALCQRYFEKSYGIDVQPGSITSRASCYHRASGSYTSAPVEHERFRVEKRAIPTTTLYSPNNGGTGTVYNRSTAINYNGYVDVPETTGFWWGVDSASISDQHFIEVHWASDAEL